MIIYRIKLKFDAELSEDISFTEECLKIFPLLENSSSSQSMKQFMYCLYKHYHHSIQYKMQESQRGEKEQKYLEKENKNLEEMNRQFKDVK